MVERRAMRASVTPSARYCCAGSPQKVPQRQHRQRPNLGLSRKCDAMPDDKPDGNRRDAKAESGGRGKHPGSPREGWCLARSVGGCHGVLRLRLLYGLNRTPASALNPVVELFRQGVDGAALRVHMPVDRHAFPLFPALYRRDIAIQISRDCLPRIEPLFGRLLHRRHCMRGLTHTDLRGGQPMVQSSEDSLTLLLGARNGRH